MVVVVVVVGGGGSKKDLGTGKRLGNKRFCSSVCLIVPLGTVSPWKIRVTFPGKASNNRVPLPRLNEA